MASEERYRHETETLEEGDVFFIRRPQAEEDEPSGLSERARHLVKPLLAGARPKGDEP